MEQQHSDLRARATVSVWLGDFRTELALDEYMREQFAADFGFEFAPEAGPEASANPKPVPIAELLDGFSQSRRFIEHAVARAAQLGLYEASSAVVFYATRYRPDLATTQSAPLRFLGAIDFVPKP